jgi:hypothetical protein
MKEMKEKEGRKERRKEGRKEGRDYGCVVIGDYHSL